MMNAQSTLKGMPGNLLGHHFTLLITQLDTEVVVSPPLCRGLSSHPQPILDDAHFPRGVFCGHGDIADEDQGRGVQQNTPVDPSIVEKVKTIFLSGSL